jgi:RES domain-containing protein
MASFLTYAVKNYEAEMVCYRARQCADKDGLSVDKMGAPPSDKSIAGRINPEGISVLYLSSNAETALSEIRASTYDYVSVGTFKAKKAFKVVSLLELASVSPFIYGDLWRYAINHSCLRDLSDTVSKPMRRNDSPLDYLPTQFVAEFIKSERYDGVEYKSAMNPGGTNIAVFDERLFECVDVQTVEVSNIQFQTEPPIK